MEYRYPSLCDKFQFCFCGWTSIPKAQLWRQEALLIGGLWPSKDVMTQQSMELFDRDLGDEIQLTIWPQCLSSRNVLFHWDSLPLKTTEDYSGILMFDWLPPLCWTKMKLVEVFWAMTTMTWWHGHTNLYEPSTLKPFTKICNTWKTTCIYCRYTL